MHILKYIGVLLLLFQISFVSAQIDHFNGTLFNNPFIINPSLAGSAEKWKADAIFRVPMDNSVTGLAKSLLLAADGNISESASIGVVATGKKAGILTESLIHFNYAYKIKFAENKFLRMGFASGLRNFRVDQSAIANANLAGAIGDPGDPVVVNYNNTPPSFFANFGAAFETEKWRIHAALPNLTSSLQNKNLSAQDNLVWVGGAEYKNQIPTASNLLPNGGSLRVAIMATGHQFKDTDITGGAYFDVHKIISVHALYSSLNGASGGFGVPLDALKVNMTYSFSKLYNSSLYGGAGILEIQLQYFFKK